MAVSTLASPQKKLGEMLVEAGLLTPEQLDRALEEAGQLQKRLGEYLVEERLVTPEDVAMTLSLQLKLPIIDLRRHPVQPEAVRLIPEEYARRYDLIPIEVSDGRAGRGHGGPGEHPGLGRPEDPGQDGHPVRCRHPQRYP